MALFDALDHHHDRVIDREEFARLLAGLRPQPLEFVNVAKKLVAVEVEEQIVELPQIEYREIVRQVPKVEFEIVEKKKPKMESQRVDKIVQVPHVVYEKRIIEEPVVEYVEVFKNVPKPVDQAVDKKVPKQVSQYFERVVHEDKIITHERAVEIPQMPTVELTRQVPKPVYQTVAKPVPVVRIQATQHEEKVGVPVKHEQPIEGSVPQTETATVQGSKCMTQAREVLRQPETCQVQVKHEIVPAELVRQKAHYVPQAQSIKLIKDSVPKYQMQYVTNKAKVGPKYMEHIEEAARWDEEWAFFNGCRIACFTMEFMEKLDLGRLILHSNFLYEAIGFTDPFPFTNYSGDSGPVVQWIINVQDQYLSQYRGLQYEVQEVEYKGGQVRMIPKEMLYTLPEKELRAYALELFQVLTLQVLGRQPPKSSKHDTKALLQYIERAQGYIRQETRAAKLQTRGRQANIRGSKPETLSWQSCLWTAMLELISDVGVGDDLNAKKFGGIDEFDQYGFAFAGPGLPKVDLPFRAASFT